MNSGFLILFYNLFNCDLHYSIDDLLQAGILEAETVVLTDQLQSMEGIYSDEEYMADAYTIVGVQTIYRLLKLIKSISFVNFINSQLGKMTLLIQKMFISEAFRCVYINSSE